MITILFCNTTCHIVILKKNFHEIGPNVFLLTPEVTFGRDLKLLQSQW